MTANMTADMTGTMTGTQVNELYVRPTGLVHGPAGVSAVAAGVAGAITGGRIGYMAVVIEEGRPGATTSRRLAYADFAASSDSGLKHLRAAIETARPPQARLDFSHAHIMGVVNVTPDSFSDGGQFAGPDEAIAHARGLVESGAGILDIGGESTRPGSLPLSEAEELARVRPVIEALAGEPTPISIDTRNASVMAQAVGAGATLINDVTALSHDPEAMATAARLETPVMLMHMQGTPETMQNEPHYDDVRLEVYDYLEARIRLCEAAGIPRARLVADPGIGFGKTFAHNVEILSALTLFHSLGVPLMVGASRKGFIGWLTGEKNPAARVSGSVAAALSALAAGAHIVRVHDVAETAQGLAVWSAINGMRDLADRKTSR